MDKISEKRLIEQAVREAEAAIERGDEPYGAVITDPEGRLLSSAGNEENTHGDPTAHAEMLAIKRAAARRGSKSLRGCSIFCSYKPCPMCAAAILMTGISDIHVGSRFQGPEELFRETADKIRAAELSLSQGIDHEHCREQVMRGRKLLACSHDGYQSGHKNGII